MALHLLFKGDKMKKDEDAIDKMKKESLGNPDFQDLPKHRISKEDIDGRECYSPQPKQPNVIHESEQNKSSNEDLLDLIGMLSKGRR